MKGVILGVAALIFTLLSIGLLLLVPPKNDIVVFGFISTLSFAGFFLSQLFVSFKYGLLVFCGIFAFLTINYLAGFQILNTALLLSVIIGIAFLLKK